MPIADRDPLGLRVPEQGDPKSDALLRPKAVEDWIQHLPAASATETTKQLLRAIQAMNRTRMPAHNRIQLAELLGSPVACAIGSLEHRYTGSSFPLSERSLRTVHVCARLYEELGFAYKIAVRDLIRGRIGTAERKLLVIGLFRSVGQLTNLLYQTVMVYEPYPRDAWCELHALFRFAETNNWSSTKVKLLGDQNTEKRVSTLRACYLEALLFAAASPYRLRQRDIRALTRLLGEWVSQERIENPTDASESATRFVVQLKQDLPPVHASLVTGAVEKPALAIETEDLIQTLRKLADGLPSEVGARPPGTRPDDIGRPLLQRLIRAWSGAPRRRFVRTQLNFDLDIAVGLPNVSTLISGEGGPSRSSAERDSCSRDPGRGSTEINLDSAFSSDLLESESGLTLVPIEDTDGISRSPQESFGLLTHKEDGPAPSIWASGPDVEPSATATLRTLNESAGGYCVQWRGPRVPGIQIGELVRIRSPGNRNSYSLATVRWMQNGPDTGLVAGLQLLATNAFTVHVTTVERRRRTPGRCLLVPELKSANRPASLITPALEFAVSPSLDVRYGDKEQRVQLARLIESTGVFSQFELQNE
jgi:hypothetical protein